MQVSINEFKSHLSKYVRQAQSGEVIELTSHRKVIARISGVPKTDVTGLTKLLTTGAASWEGGKPSGSNLVLNSSGTAVSRMIMEDRG